MFKKLFNTTKHSYKEFLDALYKHDVDFDFLELKEYLIKNKEKIEKIYYFVDDKIKNFEELKFCEDLFEELKF